MNLFANFSAGFRRYVRRPLANRERVCIERLEIQRKRYGRVRAYINDPSDSLRQVLLEYLSWHQQKLTRRDAIIISRSSTLHHPLKLRARTFSSRSISYARGCPFPVGQALILNADKFHLENALAATAPSLSGTNTILIVTGNSNTNSSFSRLFHQHQTQAAPLFQTIDPNQPIPPPKLRTKTSPPLLIIIPLTKCRTVIAHTERHHQVLDHPQWVFLTEAGAAPRANSQRTGRAGVSPPSDTTTNLDILTPPPGIKRATANPSRQPYAFTPAIGPECTLLEARAHPGPYCFPPMPNPL